MKVLLVIGSPHQKGCTYTALSEVALTLNEEGIDTDYFWIGNKPIGGCIGCYQCGKKQKCVFDDKVNEFTALAADYDGFVFGSPVYYSPVATSRYWNMVHGNTPEEVKQDEEGLQIMRYLGRNMAWLLKLKKAGNQNGVALPEQEETRFATNFIR